MSRVQRQGNTKQRSRLPPPTLGGFGRLQYLLQELRNLKECLTLLYSLQRFNEDLTLLRFLQGTDILKQLDRVARQRSTFFSDGFSCFFLLALLGGLCFWENGYPLFSRLFFRRWRFLSLARRLFLSFRLPSLCRLPSGDGHRHR